MSQQHQQRLQRFFSAPSVQPTEQFDLILIDLSSSPHAYLSTVFHCVWFHLISSVSPESSVTNKPFCLELTLNIQPRTTTDNQPATTASKNINTQPIPLLCSLAVKISSKAVEKKTNEYTPCNTVWMKATRLEEKKRVMSDTTTESSTMTSAAAAATYTQSPTTPTNELTVVSDDECDRAIGLESILIHPPKSLNHGSSKSNGRIKVMTLQQVIDSLHVTLAAVTIDEHSGILTHILTKGGSSSMRPKQKYILLQAGYGYVLTLPKEIDSTNYVLSFHSLKIRDWRYHVATISLLESESELDPFPLGHEYDQRNSGTGNAAQLFRLKKGKGRRTLIESSKSSTRSKSHASATIPTATSSTTRKRKHSSHRSRSSSKSPVASTTKEEPKAAPAAPSINRKRSREAPVIATIIPSSTHGASSSSFNIPSPSKKRRVKIERPLAETLPCRRGRSLDALLYVTQDQPDERQTTTTNTDIITSITSASTKSRSTSRSNATVTSSVSPDSALPSPSPSQTSQNSLTDVAETLMTISPLAQQQRATKRMKQTLARESLSLSNVVEESKGSTMSIQNEFIEERKEDGPMLNIDRPIPVRRSLTSTFNTLGPDDTLSDMEGIDDDSLTAIPEHAISTYSARSSSSYPYLYPNSSTYIPPSGIIMHQRSYPYVASTSYHPSSSSSYSTLPPTGLHSTASPLQSSARSSSPYLPISTTLTEAISTCAHSLFRDFTPSPSSSSTSTWVNSAQRGSSVVTSRCIFPQTRASPSSFHSPSSLPNSRQSSPRVTSTVLNSPAISVTSSNSNGDSRPSSSQPPSSAIRATPGFASIPSFSRPSQAASASVFHPLDTASLLTTPRPSRPLTHPPHPASADAAVASTALLSLSPTLRLSHSSRSASPSLFPSTIIEHRIASSSTSTTTDQSRTREQ